MKNAHKGPNVGKVLDKCDPRPRYSRKRGTTSVKEAVSGGTGNWPGQAWGSSQADVFSEPGL